MAKIPFNVDANTARLIGRQNVAKLDGAIIELIKNTYDADASKCFLYYENSTHTFIIADNGCGMSEKVIIENWMTIGRSTKTISHKSSGGRVQTGEKGIGRFALDRVGDDSKMLTINRKNKLLWSVKWDSFNFGKSITDVTADLEEVELSTLEFLKDIKNKFFVETLNEFIKSSKTGTIFVVSDLRDEWNEPTLVRIKNAIKMLVPSEYSKLFNVYFFEENTDTLDKAQLITDNDEIRYDYKIDFKVESSGDATIKIIRNEFDFGGKFDDIIKGCSFTDEDREYFNGKAKVIKTSIQKECSVSENIVGAFSGVFYYFKNSFSEKDKEIYFYKDNNLSNYNEIFTGIKIYRDGFRVRPYGEFNTSLYDWLMLSYRKNKSPASIAHPTGAWRVNANQIMGSIFISRENKGIEDQANREGIIESRAYEIFKEFIIYVIKEFESDRQYVGRKLNLYSKKNSDTQSFEEELNRQINKQKKDGKNSSAHLDLDRVKSAFDEKNEKIQFLEDENKLLRTLATTGILTNTYIHEIKGLNDKLGLKIATALDYFEEKDFDNVGLKLNEAYELSRQFAPWFNVTIDSVGQDRRKMKKLSLLDCINNVTRSWVEALKSKNITIDISEVEDVQFKCFEYEIESIFHNLIANSKASFDSHRVAKKFIKITLREVKGRIIINYCDNGFGLTEKYKKHPEKILEAFESDKRDQNGNLIGTGMGMWIINKTVSEYKGRIDLSQNINAESGFYITIILN